MSVAFEMLNGVALATLGAAAEGNAELIVEEKSSMLSLFTKGGIAMPLILIASVTGIAFAIERMVALRASRQLPSNLAEEALSRLSRGGKGAAAALLGTSGSALGKALGAVLERFEEGRAAMEGALSQELPRVLYDLRKNIRPVGVVASVAPLLGLLGTVLGMIKAFQTASRGGLGKGMELAGGIAEALLTTGAGLLVAIPALVLYHFLRARAEDMTLKVERAAAAFVNRLLRLSAQGQEGSK